ncbi:MAG: hypothetical protein AAF383_14800 [Cyanobacteria bacterium P01_A01_bin.83]
MTIKFSFPWGLYFRQLFAADTYVRLINPFNFWYKYRIKHLEKCSELDLIGHLERCYQKKCIRAKTENFQVRLDPKVYKNLADSPKSSLYKQLFIVQSSENLKYRGIEYRKPKIVGIYFDRVTFDSNLDKSHNPLTSDF